MHQTSGACAGVCNCHPIHQMEKTVIYIFNANKHLPIPFVGLVKGSHVGHLYFFCLHSITCLSIPTYMCPWSISSLGKFSPETCVTSRG